MARPKELQNPKVVSVNLDGRMFEELSKRNDNGSLSEFIRDILEEYLLKYEDVLTKKIQEINIDKNNFLEEANNKIKLFDDKLSMYEDDLSKIRARNIEQAEEKERIEEANRQAHEEEARIQAIRDAEELERRTKLEAPLLSRKDFLDQIYMRGYKLPGNKIRNFAEFHKWIKDRNNLYEKELKAYEINWTNQYKIFEERDRDEDIG